jgi:hypothetical protein
LCYTTQAAKTLLMPKQQIRVPVNMRILQLWLLQCAASCTIQQPELSKRLACRRHSAAAAAVAAALLLLPLLMLINTDAVLSPHTSAADNQQDPGPCHDHQCTKSTAAAPAATHMHCSGSAVTTHQRPKPCQKNLQCRQQLLVFLLLAPPAADHSTLCTVPAVLSLHISTQTPAIITSAATCCNH